jgi:hypothetical protein
MVETEQPDVGMWAAWMPWGQRLVTWVSVEGPADKAGVKVGDELIRVGTPARGSVSIAVERNGRRVQLRAKLDPAHRVVVPRRCRQDSIVPLSAGAAAERWSI